MKKILLPLADNSKQPNSRWYSGSGIYRNVWLVSTNDVIVDNWGTFITTPKVSTQSAIVNVKTTVKDLSGNNQSVTVTTVIYNAAGKVVAKKTVTNIALEK